MSGYALHPEAADRVVPATPYGTGSRTFEHH
jgi:hypothetical protein